ncbi:gamma-glutamyltransferase family protein [Sphingosinithalassobacter tenebrarum]|uniref:Gamma-glutamyltransferase family protein n=2 Tax=Stakelama tenebrarum TaxID=2711215 RepID=A0A6G6YA34_9SPHN|nr:gamma-glutamyltransferase family protein [Sphingosinithalassobacter tenebrarum]
MLGLVALSACAAPPAPPETASAPVAETPTPMRPTPIFVAAANPIAVETGLSILRQGGSAVDATIAMQAVLGLVEPQSSSVAGGAFLTYYDGATGEVSIYDGREVAPAGATPALFLGEDGEPLPFRTALLSGRATGVPGVLRMLELAHDDHGKIRWSGLFADAERIAREGFTVSPRLARFIHGSFPQTGERDFRAYFTGEDGALLDAGDTLRNPAYADFIARLAEQGPDALYTGPTAQRIVARTHEGPLAGSMTMADLAAYRPIKREPLCRAWRVYMVCVPPPPSSGVALLQLLGMLEHTDIADRGPGDAQAWFLFAEASRLMYADRDAYVGDSAFVDVPIEGMLDPDYVARRAALIGDHAGPAPEPGVPQGAQLAGIDATVEPTGTSHFIVRDSYGNVVSITTTVESIFGTGRMVDGFFLNNQLTDFSFAPVDDAGNPVANAVAPRKRPRSTMTPTILLDGNGDFAGAIGSAGGTAILAYVGKSLVGAVDWGLPMQDALALPNLIAKGDYFFGEVDKFPADVRAGLAERGIVIRPGQGEDSGLQGVIMREGRFDGGYDPRREGRAITELLGD